MDDYARWINQNEDYVVGLVPRNPTGTSQSQESRDFGEEASSSSRLNIPSSGRKKQAKAAGIQSEDDAIGAAQAHYKEELALLATRVFKDLESQLDDVFGYNPSQTEAVSMDLAEAIIGRMGQSLDHSLVEGEKVLVGLAKEAYLKGQDTALGNLRLTKQFEDIELLASLDDDDLAALEAAGARTNESMRNTLFFGDQDSYMAAVRDITRQAAEENWTTDRLARELREQLDPNREHFSEYMWERIARTEPAIYVTQGHLNAYESYGIPYVRWYAASDAVDECAERDGEVYPIGEAEGLIPLHPNCRCAFAPTFAED